MQSGTIYYTAVRDLQTTDAEDYVFNTSTPTIPITIPDTNAAGFYQVKQ